MQLSAAMNVNKTLNVGSDTTRVSMQMMIATTIVVGNASKVTNTTKNSSRKKKTEQVYRYRFLSPDDNLNCLKSLATLTHNAEYINCTME